VRANVIECLQKAWDAPKGFVLASGCGLPINAPRANVEALMEAARTVGRYPLRLEAFA
jgi:uroporphyrinogen decarboxylase